MIANTFAARFQIALGFCWLLVTRENHSIQPKPHDGNTENRTLAIFAGGDWSRYYASPPHQQRRWE